MFEQFFQSYPLPADGLSGFYDYRLVFLSFLVAAMASYIALDFTARLRDPNNTPTSTRLWLIGGAIAMGSGIWSMHFIGMLSFTIPGITLEYDFFWTILSLVVAILASGFALYLLRSGNIQIKYYVAGGVVLGLAIASMHYTGMQAMLIKLNIRYLPGIFLLSILVAIAASEAAIWLALKSTQIISKMRNRIKVASAIIMGIAICGMHYTGMAASIFTPLCIPSIKSSTTALDPTILAMTVAGVAIIILAIAFFSSNYQENINEQIFDKARQLGMAELSASVLHNVGNVLNSVKVSASLISEKLITSKLESLFELNKLLAKNKEKLAEFLISDPQGSKIIDYLNALADHLHQEQINIREEVTRLHKNLNLITAIISTQQDLSKTTKLEQVVSINNVIEEALLLTGVNLNKDITIEKHFGNLAYVCMDKVKLLQILVNLIKNSKEAVLESKNTQKIIKITTIMLAADIVKILISDNGIGISPKNLTRIFRYGYTSKKLGHGYGLHTSALLVNQLNGTIEALSEGINKGMLFILTFKVKLV